MIDMPERLEILRNLGLVLDEERKRQPERLHMAEVQNDQEAGIVMKLRRPRSTHTLLPLTWLDGRGSTLAAGLALGGFKLCELVRNLGDVPDDLPALAPAPKAAKEPTPDQRAQALDLTMRTRPDNTADATVAYADRLARYLAGDRPTKDGAADV